MAETDSNNDGIADFIQGLQPEDEAGLTVSTEGEDYFNRYFNAYHDALVALRDKVSEFEPLPDVVTYDSAKQTNYRLTTTAPNEVVGVFDTYIAYLDDFKEQVGGAFKLIRAEDQA